MNLLRCLGEHGSARKPLGCAVVFAGLISIATSAIAADQLSMPLSTDNAETGHWSTSVEAENSDIPAWTTTWSTVARPAASIGIVRRTADLPAKAHLAGPQLLKVAHATEGIASYYWQEQKTATGEVFNKRDLTAAHRTLPFGTRVRVTRLGSGEAVVVRINDRGPFKPGRVIDLSEAAAEHIGMTGVGVTPVRLEVLGR